MDGFCDAIVSRATNNTLMAPTSRNATSAPTTDTAYNPTEARARYHDCFCHAAGIEATNELQGRSTSESPRTCTRRSTRMHGTRDDLRCHQQPSAQSVSILEAPARRVVQAPLTSCANAAEPHKWGPSTCGFYVIAQHPPPRETVVRDGSVEILRALLTSFKRQSGADINSDSCRRAKKPLLSMATYDAL